MSTPDVVALITVVLSGVAVVAMIASFIIQAHYSRITMANLEYAERMGRVTVAILAGVENEDTAWYRTDPALPGDRKRV